MSNQKIIVDCSNGTTSYVPLSAAEIAERDQAQAAATEERANREAAAAALEATKASARAKLIAGETLTEEEAAAIVI